MRINNPIETLVLKLFCYKMAGISLPFNQFFLIVNQFLHHSGGKIIVVHIKQGSCSLLTFASDEDIWRSELSFNIAIFYGNAFFPLELTVAIKVRTMFVHMMH